MTHSENAWVATTAVKIIGELNDNQCTSELLKPGVNPQARESAIGTYVRLAGREGLEYARNLLRNGSVNEKVAVISELVRMKSAALAGEVGASIEGENPALSAWVKKYYDTLGNESDFQPLVQRLKTATPATRVLIFEVLGNLASRNPPKPDTQPDYINEMLAHLRCEFENCRKSAAVALARIDPQKFSSRLLKVVQEDGSDEVALAVLSADRSLLSADVKKRLASLLLSASEKTRQSVFRMLGDEKTPGFEEMAMKYMGELPEWPAVTKELPANACYYLVRTGKIEASTVEKFLKVSPLPNITASILAEVGDYDLWKRFVSYENSSVEIGRASCRERVS
jgi:hypothetical protein